MLRFAFSPIRDMHIGNLRVALFTSLMSRQRNEPLIVRVEESAECVESIEKETLGILELFGIEYTDVLHRSAHLRYHRAMAIQLLQTKHAFNCFCAPEVLERKRRQAEADHRPYRYDDACAELPPEQTIDNENPFTIRFRRPAEAVEFNDILGGTKRFEPEAIDSFMILDAQKLPTDVFAGAVDDMLSDISLVIRDEASLIDAPRQIAVRSALGYERSVEYAHLPSLTGDMPSVKRLLEDGYLPDAIANYLLRLGHDTPDAVFTLREAVEWFDLSGAAQAPAHFELDELTRLNREHLRRMDPKELSRYVGFADEQIGRLAQVYLDEAATTKALRAKVDAIFGEKCVPDVFAGEAEALRAAIRTAPYIETFDAFAAHLSAQTALEGEALMTPLRVLLTGATDGPDAAELYPHLKNYLGEIVK